MSNCVDCQKKVLVKFIFLFMNLKTRDVAKILNVSQSLVSKYLAGERGSTSIDIYLIEKIFNIQIKEYQKNG